MNILEVKDLSAYYKTRKGYNQALDKFSITLREGEVLALIGESGCGKSTAGFSIMNMIQHPGEVIGGKVLLNQMDLLSLQEGELRKVLWKEISMIPQSAMNALDPAYKVGSQIVEAIRLHNPGMGKAQARQKTEELLLCVGLDQKWFDAFPHKLSGGMKQRIIIAMALSCEPKVIISDESTTGLDVLIEAQILALLRKQIRERGISVILISHDLRMVMSICDRVGIMYAGKLVELGTIAEIKDDPKHPYTRALFASQVDVRDFSKTVHSVEGVVPQLIDPADQCRFLSRCNKSIPRCQGVHPGMYEVSPTHLVSCYLEAKE